MDVPTRSSSVPNGYARAAAVVGLLAAAAVPGAVAIAELVEEIEVIYAGVAIAPAAALGVAALVLAHRARLQVERTLGRARGLGLARLGRLLGTLGLCLAGTATLALAFYAFLAS